MQQAGRALDVYDLHIIIGHNEPHTRHTRRQSVHCIVSKYAHQAGFLEKCSNIEQHPPSVRQSGDTEPGLEKQNAHVSQVSPVSFKYRFSIPETGFKTGL